MSEDGAERRKRLKALKEKAANKSIKFRNYRPQDAAIRQQALDSKDTGRDKKSISSSSGGGGGSMWGDAAISSEVVKGAYVSANSGNLVLHDPAVMQLLHK